MLEALDASASLTLPGFGGLEITLAVLLLLVLAGFSAGWVDAVVGGGGLIQVPALLVLFPDMSAVQALATNKVGSIMGTSTSSITYYRRIHPDMRTAAPMAVCALLASVGGAALASHIPEAALRPIIIVVLVGVLVYTLLKPQVGTVTELRWEGNRHYGAAAGIGLAVGLYDGLLGPGTGSFLVMGLVGVIGYAFLPASAIAKIVNFATNLGALAFFVPAGHVVWGVGLVVGTANLCGAYLGARMAVAKGNRFVRIAFLVVVAALIVRLAWDILG